eukprot:m.65075 g.65075  ORF g.65075 m.65075 type:complete len:372 (+) comp8141_c0_seq1:38-1153(+)
MDHDAESPKVRRKKREPPRMQSKVARGRLEQMEQHGSVQVTPEEKDTYKIIMQKRDSTGTKPTRAKKRRDPTASKETRKKQKKKLGKAWPELGDISEDDIVHEVPRDEFMQQERRAQAWEEDNRANMSNSSFKGQTEGSQQSDTNYAPSKKGRQKGLRKSNDADVIFVEEGRKFRAVRGVAPIDSSNITQDPTRSLQQTANIVHKWITYQTPLVLLGILGCHLYFIHRLKESSDICDASCFFGNSILLVSMVLFALFVLVLLSLHLRLQDNQTSRGERIMLWICTCCYLVGHVLHVVVIDQDLNFLTNTISDSEYIDNVLVLSQARCGFVAAGGLSFWLISLFSSLYDVPEQRSSNSQRKEENDNERESSV